MNASATRCKTDPRERPSAFEPMQPETAEYGAAVSGIRRREARATKVWRNIKGGFLGLQPIEIPQNRQNFLWKSLEQNTLDLEKLGKMQADRHYFAISTMSAGEALPGGSPHR